MLQPATVVLNAQVEYNETPELADLLALAAGSETVRRTRTKL